MDDHHRRRGRSRAALAAAAVLVVAGVGTVLTGLRDADGSPPQPGPEVAVAARTSGAGVGGTAPDGADPATGSAAATGSAVPAGSAAGAAAVPGGGEAGASSPSAMPAPRDLGPILPRSRPVTVEIPSIGVRSDVIVPLEVGADGVLAAPADYDLPGWHTRGPAPGQLGPSVIAGHVDGPSGPAVFHRLGDLAVGDVVHVTREDGTVATFTIDAVEQYRKDAFPTSRVYGNTTDRAEIRLITCGGAFDRGTGHYVDNVVAFGHLVG